MLDIMQRKRENMSPKIGSAYCLEEVPRAQGGVSQVGPISLSWDEAGSPKSIIECTDPSTREESTKQKGPQWSEEGPPWVFSTVLISAYLWGNYPGLEKESPKRIIY